MRRQKSVSIVFDEKRGLVQPIGCMPQVQRDVLVTPWTRDAFPQSPLLESAAAAPSPIPFKVTEMRLSNALLVLGSPPGLPSDGSGCDGSHLVPRPLLRSRLPSRSATMICWPQRTFWMRTESSSRESGRRALGEVAG